MRDPLPKGFGRGGSGYNGYNTFNSSKGGYNAGMGDPAPVVTKSLIDLTTVGISTKGCHVNLVLNANLLKGVNTVIHLHME